MARPEKAAAVEQIRQQVVESQAALLTEYRGLTVAELRQLRSDLRADATYAVVKNTLTKIALREAGVEAMDTTLTGPTAIAYVHGDAVTAAKTLREFARTHHALIVKGGIMDGRSMTAAEVTRLADLDSREVTLAKLAGVLKASLVRAAYMFQAPTAKAVRTIDALRDKQAQASAA
jgi:large subunit ribosomal protein L10